MGRPKKYPNPILKYAKKVQDENLYIDVRVWLAILLSTGCRPSEAREYRYLKKEGDTVTIKMPVKKKRRDMTRVIPILPKLFGLTASDFKGCSGVMRSLKTYTRYAYKLLGINPRDYRHELSIFVLRKKNLMYVKEMLCHTDIRTTQIYLDGEKADFLEIASL